MKESPVPGPPQLQEIITPTKVPSAKLRRKHRSLHGVHRLEYSQFSLSHSPKANSRELEEWHEFSGRYLGIEIQDEDRIRIIFADSSITVPASAQEFLESVKLQTGETISVLRTDSEEYPIRIIKSRQKNGIREWADLD